MATWIDDEGRLREREDENYQLVLLPETNGEVWHVMDSWGMQLACRLIVLGYNLDVGEALNFGFKECPHGSTGNDRAYAIHTVMDRALTLAKSAVAIGRIKDPDTPANWLAWAKGKGYSVAHLEPDTAAPSGAPESDEEPATLSTSDRVGIQSAEIINGFRLDDTWLERLRKPDRNKYLLPALAQRGRAGGDPHRWNPAKFGAILIRKGERNRRAVAEVIYRHFTGWSDEWDAMPE